MNYTDANGRNVQYEIKDLIKLIGKILAYLDCSSLEKKIHKAIKSNMKTYFIYEGNL